MAAPKWAAGKTYLPGAVVQPMSSTPASIAALTNPSFESDATDWTLTAGVSVSTGFPFSGTKHLKFAGSSGVQSATHAQIATYPGAILTASCYYHQGAASRGKNVGRCFIEWRNSGGTVISRLYGNSITSSKGGYQRSSVTATAPSQTAFVAVGVEADMTDGNDSNADYFMLSQSSAQPSLAGLIYKAVQSGPGVSAATEPAWPSVNGVTVVDGTVTWEAITASFVEWTAKPIMKSGATEPVWPTNVGGTVIDGDVVWEAVDRRIEDGKCPQSKVVAIMASKVFAADKDIVRFSATANPLDWSSPDDAGYLPTGLQQANAADLAVLQPYRGNLCAWNASSFQMWQVDPDPAAMALLDQMDGVGSEWALAAQAVGNDLYYLSQLGVRSVNIANAAENLQAGDVGIPIDPLVQEAIAEVLAAQGEFIATYYPSAGQYWLARNIASGGEA